MKRCLQPSQNPVAFSTGGGPQPSQDSLGFKGSAILQDEEVYVLKECPPAQSIGKTVVDKGYLFVWDPREKVPYLVAPQELKRCRLRVPRNARICASRVVEYVPQYDEEITPIPYQKPERLVPVQPVANPAPTAEESKDEADEFLAEFSKPDPSSSSRSSGDRGDHRLYVDPDADPSVADPMDVAPPEGAASSAPERSHSSDKHPLDKLLKDLADGDPTKKGN